MRRAGGIGWTIASLVCAAAASLGLVLLPTGVTETATYDSSGDSTAGVSRERTTLLESEGLGVLAVLLVPPALPLMALVIRRRTPVIALGAVFLVPVVLARLSIGIFYLPAAILLLVAGLQTPAGRTSRPIQDAPRGG